jgi:hypothetical protein
MMEDEARRGDQAAIVLGMPIVQEVLKNMREEIISQWSETPARDAEGRDWIWRHYKVLEKFEGLLKGYMESGRMAKMQMNEKSKPVT